MKNYKEYEGIIIDIDIPASDYLDGCDSLHGVNIPETIKLMGKEQERLLAEYFDGAEVRVTMILHAIGRLMVHTHGASDVEDMTIREAIKSGYAPVPDVSNPELWVYEEVTDEH